MARELKYSTPDTDFAALQRELSGQSSNSHPHDEDEKYEDPYDPYADEDDEDDGYRR
ncbi:hypothetical protein FHX46_000355 [Amycolatopsis viridis]|uniref:DUF3073 domain-containing protein n=1 Tax=Amycolatopsis viridis TaxID=185678 RepID=A0ABX0SR58_9PSEU|nr:hypothetical protein [Amycolatopsis viridis]